MLSFHSFKYLFKAGFFIPFKVRKKAVIRIGDQVDLKLGSRVCIGPDPSLAVISALPALLQFCDRSTVTFGEGIVVGPGVNLIVKKSGKLEIGSSTYFTSDSHVEVVKSVSIGKNCAISWGVTIIDSDHHQLIVEGKQKECDGTVVIEDHVWVGCNVTILKNTRIGHDSVVAAGSVVRGDFPPNSLIAGNPARLVKTNISWK